MAGVSEHRLLNGFLECRRPCPSFPEMSNGMTGNGITLLTVMCGRNESLVSGSDRGEVGGLNLDGWQAMVCAKCTTKLT
jgi:hypothetical protein